MSLAPRRPRRTVAWLAYRDFVFERRISACFVLALTAILAPLLILFGLKFGLVDTIATRLREDPGAREIIGVGSNRFTDAWFAQMRDTPEVGFIIPYTRSLSAGLNLVTNEASGQRLTGLKIVPTRLGDPILRQVSRPLEGPRHVILSAPAAEKLNAEPGSVLSAWVHRRSGGAFQRSQIDLTVADVAPLAAHADEAMFASLEFLVATEDYRDGLRAEISDPSAKEGPGVAGRTYPRFRLYATSIYDVAPLRDLLREEGVETRTRADEIETYRALDRNLGFVFWLIAGIAGAGFLASLGASLTANVDRKRRELSVLRLVGLSAKDIALFPAIQAALIALCGVAIALLIYFAFAASLNVFFAEGLQKGELVCRLLPEHVACAVLLTLASAALASLWGGFRAAQIDPSSGMRDG